MTTFATPDPISVTVEIGIGSVHLAASDRIDTVVEVRPSNPSKKSDVVAAENTRVEYTSGRLLISTPRRWRQLSLWSSRESVDVHVELPSDSSLAGEAGVASLDATGQLGAVTYKTGVGDVHVEAASSLEAKSGVGGISAGRVGGTLDVKTASGRIELGSVAGTAVVKNSNGDTWIGEAEGDVRVQSANGRIAVERAHASVVAKTSNGDLRLGLATGGSISADTAFGHIDIGVLQGLAVWMDLHTHFGTVDNKLDRATRPEPGETTAEVRARTAFGDITVHHLADMATPTEAA